jgi:cyclohexanecarboxylate-CoA ligase
MNSHPFFPRPPAERRKLFRTCGGWDDEFIDGHVQAARRSRPDSLAVVDGTAALTWSQLDDMVDRTGAGLQAIGVSPGDVVSWQLPNWHEAIIVHHAALRIGAVSNPIVPIYRRREVGYILRTSRTKVFVVPETFRGFSYESMIGELGPELPDLTETVYVRAEPDSSRLSFRQLGASDPAGLRKVGRSPDDPALLMFTSGTTAHPKGVVHSHNTLNYENRSIAEVYALGADDRVFMPSPLSHITGMLYGVQLPAMLGIGVVLQDAWDVRRALELISTYGCTFTMAATPFLHGLTYHEDLGQFDVSSLRVFACGGADVPAALIRDAQERLGCWATRVYGSTELPTLSTTAPSGDQERAAHTDGCTIGAATFRILDERDKSVGPGAVGELCVDGPERFLGYLNSSDEAGAFTADGLFRTGDLASADEDGYLTIRGRKKDIILRGGENISVSEIEELLFEHPAVREVAVVAMPDPVMVERACAFVVPQPGRTVELGELTGFLRSSGIAVQKLPERLEIVAELPKTLSGKVQKFRLRQQIAALIENESSTAQADRIR